MDCLTLSALPSFAWNYKGPILIVLTTRSYALTSDATGVANAICLFWVAKLVGPCSFMQKRGEQIRLNSPLTKFICFTEHDGSGWLLQCKHTFWTEIVFIYFWELFFGLRLSFNSIFGLFFLTHLTPWTEISAFSYFITQCQRFYCIFERFPSARTCMYTC